MENNNLASEKQIAFLKKLGYTGNTDGLSSEDASALIKQMQGGSKNPTNQNQVATTNNNVGTAKKPAFSSFMATVGTKLVANTITDEKRKTQFIANIVSAVSNNPTLQECDSVSVIGAGLQAEAMHFPINNALGYCYLVPFNDKKSDTKKAQFQIGYKGYIQLAIRTGQYKNINVCEVREGELNDFDPLKGMTFNWNKNYEERKHLKVIGYAGEFTLMNGFTRTLYIPYEEMLDHADTYSQAFNKQSYLDLLAGKIPQKDMWRYSSFWYKNFDEMAKKTVLRQLLSKWGIMSVEMQQAYENDQASFDANGKRDYIDSKDLENQNIEQVMSQQININASESFDVVDDETGEVNNNADTNIFGEFIDRK